MSVPAEQSLCAERPAFSESTAEEGVLSHARQAAQHERLVLAQTLHDTLCQSLSGIQLITTLAERKATQHHPELAGDLSELRGMVRTACDDVHQLVEQLRTPPR